MTRLITNAAKAQKPDQTGVILNVFLIPAHLCSAAGKGLIICTGTAAVKPKNNPQSVVRCEQSTPSAADCPSGGKKSAKTAQQIHT